MNNRIEDFINNLESQYNELEKDIQSLKAKMSNVDKKLSDHYHKIETNKFNACQGYKLAKELQVILHERRKIKNEWTNLHSSLSTIGIKHTDFRAKIKDVKSKLKQRKVQQIDYLK